MSQKSKSRSRKFGLRTKLSLLVAAFLFAFISAEVLLRLAWHNPYANDGADRVVKLRMQHANTNHRIDRSTIPTGNPTATLRTNDRSYILPMDQYENPDCSIAFLGGSTTECFAVEEESRFPAVVSTRFDELDSSLVGVVRQTLSMHTVVPEHPDDLDQGELERRNIVANQLEQVEYQYEQRLRLFARMCDAFGAKPVLMTQPMSGKFNSLTPNWVNDSAQTRFNQIVRRVAKEEDAVLVDLAEHLRSNVPGWDEHMNVFYDGVHVTDEGSRVYAEKIVECLLPIVQEFSFDSGEGQTGPRLADDVDAVKHSR